jgi:ubiquinone biosynthesis monooxygenase Coq7
LTPALLADLRSDHAGETGAVAIYRGILALGRREDVREFARQHLVTEQQHLCFFDAWLPPSLHSRLLALWRVCGWLLGAVAALGGGRLVFVTVDAVETFVVEHYRQQIEALAEDGPQAELRRVLAKFQGDENAHRLEALAGADGTRPPWERGWCRLIGWGSAVAVRAARRL